MSRRGGSYSRVPRSEAGASAYESHGHGGHDEAAAARRKRKELVETVSNKMHALVWVGLAAFTIYYTDLLRTVWKDERVTRWALDLSVVCFGVVLMVGGYLVVYLPYIAKIHLEWNVYCPRMIPTATIFGLLSIILFGVAMWPVWGLLTPVIIAILFMGFLFSAHFIPSF